MQLNTRISFIALSSVLAFAACNLKKVTKVSLQNKNDYPLEITLKANNCKIEIKAEANSKSEAMLDWTNIEKTDGSYQLMVNHGRRNVDTFTHGYFTNGQLTNYLDLIIEKHEVKVSPSE
jgi:hypothetical protein